MDFTRFEEMGRRMAEEVERRVLQPDDLTDEEKERSKVDRMVAEEVLRACKVRRDRDG